MLTLHLLHLQWPVQFCDCLLSAEPLSIPLPADTSQPLVPLVLVCHGLPQLLLEPLHTGLHTQKVTPCHIKCGVPVHMYLNTQPYSSDIEIALTINRRQYNCLSLILIEA